MTSIPMLAVVGVSDSGKTTLIESLLPLLALRGLRVGTVKHHAHATEPDLSGKDSWRHARAGARVVVLAGPHSVMTRRVVNGDPRPEELARHFEEEVDLVLVEGYSLSDLPKIEVFSPTDPKPSRLANTAGLVATVRAPKPLQGVPDFRDATLPALVDLIESWHLEHAQTGIAPAAGGEDASTVRIVLDGRELSLKPFLSRMLAGLVRGFLSSLRGVGNPGQIEITVSRR